MPVSVLASLCCDEGLLLRQLRLGSSPWLHPWLWRRCQALVGVMPLNTVGADVLCPQYSSAPHPQSAPRVRSLIMTSANV